MYTAEIVERSGYLFIMDDWERMWDKPVAFRTAWPTGICARDYAHLIGQRCTYMHDGLYRCANGTIIALELYGKTLPSAEHQEERPVKRPRGRRTYSQGKWR